MDATTEKQKKESFLMCFVYIFLFIFRGIKFVLIEAIPYFYDVISGTADRTYETTKQGFMTLAEQKELKKEAKMKKRQESYEKLFWVKSRMNYYKKKQQELLATLDTDGSVRSKKAVVYQYTARNSKGKVETDIFYGYSKLDVYTFLISEGYDVYMIETSKWITWLHGDKSILSSKMSNKDLIFWLTQLSTYIKAGISLTESIRILGNQMGKNKAHKRVFQAITYELVNGESFSNCLEKQGKMFPNLLINMVKAAEATGDLESTLADMGNYYSEIEKTRKEMISAITYPSVILVFAVAVITFILLYVIPQFENIYSQSSAQITGLTAIVLNSSKFLKANGIWIALGTALVVILLIYLYNNVKAARKTMQYVFMHIPVLKDIIIYNEITVFTKTFASLLRNNVFITTSVDILSKITNNEIYKEIMINTVNNIIEGRNISDAFKNQWAIPEAAYYMIVTGESTGELDVMMQTVSDYYSEQHRSIINGMKSFIEPIMIAGLAIIVGTIVLAVVIPMFNLMGSVG